jgi:hypothetical protein
MGYSAKLLIIKNLIKNLATSIPLWQSQIAKLPNFAEKVSFYIPLSKNYLY